MTTVVDVLIVGGSLGAVAAALAAGRSGASVLLVAPSSWLGGQLTSQGVCTPDENAWIEHGGCTASYRALRHRVREYYATTYRLSVEGRSQKYLNPGSCWVSRISVEPRVAMRLLEEQLAAFRNVAVWRNARAVRADVARDRVESVTFTGTRIGTRTVTARFILDGTDLGDLLPLAGAEHRVGAESWYETGQPDAPREPRPDCIQPFTVPFALELRPAGEDHTIARPPRYEHWKRVQGYHVLDGAMRGMFCEYGWWYYRRVICAANFDDAAFPCDVAMINTGSNDYRGGTLPTLDSAAARQHLRQSRQASLGYVYWLQTECPREENPSASGYPELRLRGDWFGTPDGLAPEPYIRESRRIRAMTTVFEQDIVVQDGHGRRHQTDSRALFRHDSVGIGHYWLDIHPGASDEPGLFLETRPFQIPLGALVPIRIRNLLPACKNLGVTHLSNGAFRLHPIEWNVGESAGMLAAFCVAHQVEPRDVLERETLLHRFQDALLSHGIPLYWWGDLVPGTDVWKAAQWLAQRGVWPVEQDICFRPREPVPADFPFHRPGCPSRESLALALYAEAHRVT